jgi:hypothetical protein
LGEITTLTKNTKNFASLKTTIPISMVRQWNLQSGDKLDWSWQSVNNEMVVMVRKAVNKEIKTY